MKWISFLFILLCFCHGYVYGARTKEIVSLDIEPIETKEDDIFYIKAGLTQKILCKGSTRSQKVEWYNPSGLLVTRQPSHRIHVQDNSMPSFRTAKGLMLSITDADVADSGVWECRSGALRKTFSVCILDPIEILNEESEISIDKGRSITLSCYVKGDPEPVITWERDGVPITDNTTSSKYKVMTSYRSEGVEGLLTVTSADTSDAGVYTCMVQQDNQLVDDCSLKIQRNVTLDVNHAPSFDDCANDTFPVYGLYNESVNLNCFAGGHPIPRYRWFHITHDGDVLTEYPQASIELSEEETIATLTQMVNASTIGQKYRCKSSNIFGDDSLDFIILELVEPPNPTIKPSEATHESIKLEWDKDENLVPVDSVEVQYFPKKTKTFPKAEYYWRRSKKVIISKEDESVMEPFVTITDLREDTEYWIRLQLVNGAGNSGWSLPVLGATVSIPEEPIPTTEAVKENVDEIIKPMQVPESSNTGLYYGMICLAGLLFVAITCMLVVKRL